MRHRAATLLQPEELLNSHHQTRGEEAAEAAADAMAETVAEAEAEEHSKPTEEGAHQ